MQIPLSSLVKTRKAQWIQLEISLLAAVVVMTACASPFLPPTPTPFSQPESPLIPGKNVALAENRWRLLEIIYSGTNVAFDTIQPIYITFSLRGQLAFSTTDCNGAGFTIIAESEYQYRLIPGTVTAMGCGKVGDKQFSDVNRAIAITTEFELKDTQLILIGEGVQVVLEIDNPQ